jgi:hypothetical protein
VSNVQDVRSSPRAAGDDCPAADTVHVARASARTPSRVCMAVSIRPSAGLSRGLVMRESIRHPDARAVRVSLAQSMTEPIRYRGRVGWPLFLRAHPAAASWWVWALILLLYPGLMGLSAFAGWLDRVDVWSSFGWSLMFPIALVGLQRWLWRRLYRRATWLSSPIEGELSDQGITFRGASGLRSHMGGVHRGPMLEEPPAPVSVVWRFQHPVARLLRLGRPVAWRPGSHQCQTEG